MNYQLKGTSRIPALVIFLIDVSASMGQPLGNKTRIEVVIDDLRSIITGMVHRSTRGSVISPRYHIEIFVSTRGSEPTRGARRRID